MTEPRNPIAVYTWAPQVAQADDEYMLQEKKKAEDAYRRKVTTLFRQVDTSGDGKIDAQEFKRLLKAPNELTWPLWEAVTFEPFKLRDKGIGSTFLLRLRSYKRGSANLKLRPGISGVFSRCLIKVRCSDSEFRAMKWLECSVAILVKSAKWLSLVFFTSAGLWRC